MFLRDTHNMGTHNKVILKGLFPKVSPLLLSKVTHRKLIRRKHMLLVWFNLFIKLFRKCTLFQTFILGMLTHIMVEGMFRLGMEEDTTVDMVADITD